MTVVGITVGAKERSSVVAAYVASVLAAGGTPVLLPTPLGDPDQIDKAVSRVDALLLSGGGDVHPAEYGETTRTTLDAVDRRRDRMELIALRAARDNQMRVLGICRGAQLLVVATGGSLIQDLPAAGYLGHFDENHDRGYATLRHGIKAEVGSCADRALDGLVEINSHHHQAIRDVGNELIATAWADDGIIEAVEGPSLFGLQWHPETLFTTDVRHLEPFRWLVGAE
jgi:putative glutamine amidotransferase